MFKTLLDSAERINVETFVVTVGGHVNWPEAIYMPHLNHRTTEAVKTVFRRVASRKFWFPITGHYLRRPKWSAATENVEIIASCLSYTWSNAMFANTSTNNFRYYSITIYASLSLLCSTDFLFVPRFLELAKNALIIKVPGPNAEKRSQFLNSSQPGWENQEQSARCFWDGCELVLWPVRSNQPSFARASQHHLCSCQWFERSLEVA